MKLRAGKFYVTRDGMVVGPMYLAKDKPDGFFYADNRRNRAHVVAAYSTDGSVVHDIYPDPGDLIVEINDKIVEKQLHALLA